MPRSRPYVVAVTGGIGSGKTTVCEQFWKQFNIPTVDTDQVARDVVAPGEPGLAAVVAAFGQHILTPTGTMDRDKVREIVFSDPAKRKVLEDILHPRIRENMSEQIEALKVPYCLLGIPLLNSGHNNPLIDRILVVDCPEKTQIARVTVRDGLTVGQAEAIMRTQASREERLELADDIIVNDGNPDDLADQIHALHAAYLKLAQDSI